MEPVKFRLSLQHFSENHRNKNSSRHHQVKQTRKISTVSIPNDAKAKSSKNKERRSSSIRDTESTAIVTKSCNLESNNDNKSDLTIIEELPVVHENENNEVTQEFQQMKIEEEIEQIDLHLEERLAHDQTYKLIGIMNLSSMNLTDRDIPKIIQRAFHNKQNKCFGLNLRDNALTSDGIKILVDAVIDLPTNVRYLCLSDNPNIGDTGIEHLQRLLRTSRSLTFLALPNTGITDRGVRLLADALCLVGTDSSCAPLEKLYISFNKSITDESLVAVLEIIEQNPTLKVFSVQHCSFSVKAHRLLKQVGTKMKKNKFSLSG